MSRTSEDISVNVTVDGHGLDDQQRRVVEKYEQNIETFLRKNADYGGSFENSAKMESILRHGEVREDDLFDIIAEQILVRGFYDKLSRFHQLVIQGSENNVGEEVEDTLLDMGNYAVMLAAMHEKYDEADVEFDDDNYVFVMDDDYDWEDADVEEFLEDLEP